MIRYEAYKPSGIDWIGEVPKQWQYKRLKNITLAQPKSKIPAGEGQEEGIYPFFTSSVNLNKFYDEPTFENLEALIMGTGGIASLHYYKGDFSVSTDCYVLTKSININLKFIYFSLYCQLDTVINDIGFDGQGLKHLQKEFINNYPFYLPTPVEQLAITNYLDNQTEKIDRLIANKKAQVEKLKELRQIEINNAVNKGLNPNPEMKDSGIEWLGKIPKHWEVKKVKQLLRPEKNAIKTGPFGSDLKFEDLVDQGVKVYNQRSVLDNDWVSGEGYITEEKYKSLETCTIYPGDIVITTRGTIGKVSIFPDNAELGILHPCLMRVQMNNYRILNDFLKIIINESGYFLEALKLASNATTIDVVYSDNLKEVKIALPPPSEQKSIIEFVFQRTIAIDKLIKNIEAQIEKLQELRKIKIYEAVTGKIKVNDYAETTA